MQKILNFRLNAIEREALDLFAKMQNKTKTEIIKEFIQSLLPKVKHLRGIDPLLLPSIMFNLSKLLPKEGGIYFLMNLDGAVNYIGYALNLNERFLNKSKLFESLDLDRTVIKFQLMPEPTKEYLENLTKKFKPTLSAVKP